MIGLAAAAGQFLGGFLTQLDLFGLGWRSVFLINVPIGLATIAGAVAFVPPLGAVGKPKLDLIGAVLVSLTLACLVLPLSEGRQHGWPAWTFAMLASLPVLVVALLKFEAALSARGGMPVIDLALFRVPGFGRGVLVARSTSSRGWAWTRWRPGSRSCRMASGCSWGRSPPPRCRCGCARICWASAWRSRCWGTPRSWSPASHCWTDGCCRR
jgi:MFS family permease